MSEQRAAGLPLDIEIQRAVFGSKTVYCRHGDAWDGANAAPGDRAFFIPSGKPWRTHHIDARPLPKFSTDMRDAWAVMEQMKTDGYVSSLRVSVGAAPYGCGFWSGASSVHKRDGHYVDAETMPLAICRSALLVHETREKQRQWWAAKQAEALAAAGATEEAGDGR